MKIIVTEYQIKLYLNRLINEVVRSSDYSDDFPVYDYTSIKLVPTDKNPNNYIIFFNGPKFRKTDYQKPNEPEYVTFSGPQGEFEFHKEDIFFSKKSGTVFTFLDKIKNNYNFYYDKFYDLIDKPTLDKSNKTYIITEPQLQTLKDNGFIVKSKKDSINTSKIDKSSNNNLTDDGLIPNRDRVIYVLRKLGTWLYSEEGLGLQKTIDNILDSKKTNISDKDKKDNIKGAEILYRIGKLNQYQYKWFIESLINRKLVYDEEGNWHYVNKLNTNYIELSELLCDFLFESYNNGGLASKKILTTINNTDKIPEIENILMFYKNQLSIKLNERYSKSPEDLFKYVEYSKISTEKGEKVENDVRDRLVTNYSAEISYQGGNGNFVDMIFSVDLIIKTINNRVLTIQVKSKESQVDDFIKNKKNHKYVDLVVWPDEDDGFNYKDVKSPRNTGSLDSLFQEKYSQ
jgi:hypothetical protein